MDLIQTIAQTLTITPSQIEKTLALLEEGNTVPFIARYRKEMTGNLDEEQIRVIEEQYKYGIALEKRKADVLRLIAEQAKLTPELEADIQKASKLSVLEDLYRPYAQKKKTRASAAIALGLEPLADAILKNQPLELEKYLNDGIVSEQDALQGAKDIIAERVSDEPKHRTKIKESMLGYGRITASKKKNAEDDGMVFQMYYEFSERIGQLAPHRIMALDRGEKLGILTISLVFDEAYNLEYLYRAYKRGLQASHAELVEAAINDGFKRLLVPSLTRMIRSELSEKAHESSIGLFSNNLEQILVQTPIKDKVILGFDPAFRTGCKLAVIDARGEVLEIAVIYPHAPINKYDAAKTKLKALIEKHHINIIAIGNGTASRESESFVADTIQCASLDCAYTIVSEAGASVYSASKLAKEEFPDLHVEERSAISIARRIMDPLSELIKIDPQAIGVGQYQHDLAQKQLQERLDFVVDKVVNRVGVNVNTASEVLLSHVSGINKAIAKEIVSYRQTSGALTSRSELKKVKKLGPKAFEQAAGFLRIVDGKDPLDATGLHPENYALAKAIQKAYSIKLGDQEAIASLDFTTLKQSFDLDPYVFADIKTALQLDVRDYREAFSAPILRSDILKIDDLNIGDALEGVVRNIVDFGVFVDIGLKSDGLAHISKLARQRVSHPSQVCKIGDILTVYVIGIDLQKQKVQLSFIKQ
ncbi:MAG: Tex-like N-terminal domain-containing protein [Erysipelotrichaceae bacterium]